jgi:RNA polymerase sigma-70 factor (ECF subfamily)
VIPFGAYHPDPELLAAAVAGERVARAEIYAALSPAVHALARRITASRATADDVLQDTFVAVFEHLATFRGEAPFALWVRRIALTRCLMHLRSPWHRLRDALAGFGETLESPAAVASIGDLLDVQRALERLSPQARAVVWLYEVEGCTHEEIARIFGRSVSFSKSQLARAQRTLRAAAGTHSEEWPCPTPPDSAR